MKLKRLAKKKAWMDEHLGEGAFEAWFTESRNYRRQRTLEVLKTIKSGFGMFSLFKGGK